MLSHFTGNMSRIFTPLGGIGVSMFLILSGYGLNESFKKNGLDGFWKKRFLRIWIPYAIAFSLLCFYQPCNFREYLFNLICYHCPYWYIKYTICWYIVFWLTARFLPKYKLPVMAVAGFSTLFWCEGVRGEQAISFVTGVFISDRDYKIDETNKLGIKWLITLAFVGLVFLAFKQTGLYRSFTEDMLINISQLPVKWCLALFVIYTLAYLPLFTQSRFLTLSGILSYELYLLHFPLRGLAGSNISYAIGLITASYIAAYILYQYDNRLSKLFSK